MVQIEC